MADENRDPDVTDQEILAVFANRDETRLRSREVADELPIDTESLIDRLDDLNELDLIERDDDEPGDAWYLTEEGTDELTIPDEAVETDVEAQATKTTGVEAEAREQESPGSPPPDPQEDPVGSVRQTPLDVPEAFDPPGTPREQDSRRDALRRVQEYVRTGGPVDRDDVQRDVFPEASAGYDRPEEWWDELVRPGLEAFEDVTFREADGSWDVVADSDDSTDI